MMLQLHPTIPLHTELGPGRALLVIDYGTDINTIWVVALDNGGQIKHFDSNQVTLQENYTLGTTKTVI